ncbi:MAG TPA: TonB-dependent receptor [Clostridia bacterium]|nr:TonB-dependent receptor [Clostridia bacterium]
MNRILLVALILLSGTVFAQDSKVVTKTQDLPIHRETVVVTGSYQPVEVNDSDRSVNAIEVGLRVPLYRNFVDVLRADPALDLRQRAPGIQTDLSVRGASFEQTLILVDGLRVNDAQSSHHNMDLPLPFEALDRVEILHGSGSTMYGADAVGGVVNFITAPASMNELRFAVGGGNYGTDQQRAQLSLAGKNFSQRFSATRERSTGFMADRDYRSLGIASESHVKTRLGDSTVLLGLSDRPFGANQFYGNFDSWERTKGWFVGAKQELGADTRVDFGYRRHTDVFILSRKNPAYYENNHVTESFQASLRRRRELKENLTLFYGVEGYRDNIASSNLGYHGRNRGAFYGNLDLRLNRWTFSIAGREELYGGTNNEFSPTLSAGYRLSEKVKLRASAGHGFRLPTYTDLYYRDPANQGNPALRAESAWSYEGGLVWHGNPRLSGELTLFTRRVRDGIDYVRSTGSAPWQAANIDRLNFTGIEATSRLRLGQSQELQLACMWLHGSQAAALTGLQSRYVSTHPVKQGTLEWRGLLPARLELRSRLGVTERIDRATYPLMEVSATRQFGALRPYIQLTNATSTGYEEIQGVRMPGRQIVLGVEFRLGLGKTAR